MTDQFTKNGLAIAELHVRTRTGLPLKLKASDLVLLPELIAEHERRLLMLPTFNSDRWPGVSVQELDWEKLREGTALFVSEGGSRPYLSCGWHKIVWTDGTETLSDELEMERWNNLHSGQGGRPPYRAGFQRIHRPEVA